MTGQVAIVGAGYVGLPLAQVFAGAGNRVVLVEANPEKVELVERGESYIRDVPSEGLAPLVESGAIEITTDYDVLKEADAILIALQTPLTAQREPDLSIVLGAAADIAPRLQKGQLVVLESTTYPGTTRERLRPILESGSGLVAGEDFHLAFSPERVDPGREDWTTQNTPKIVGGLTPACTERAVELYSRALETVHPVSSPEAAELTKLLENIFRSVNIALVNELAQLCDRMQIDVWEVDRRGRDEAVRVHELPAGPGARRPLHADRPLLPDLEGARIRLLHRVHRARGQGQREHAVLVPRQDRPRAERAREGRSRARRSSSSASPTRRTSTTRASRRR